MKWRGNCYGRYRETAPDGAPLHLTQVAIGDSLIQMSPDWEQRVASTSSSRATFRIELLGRFRITRGGEPVTTVNTNRLKSLLTYLVLHDDAPQPREHLAFLLWPDSGEAQARTNLRQLLHHLRRSLPDECGFLSADNQTVQWRRAATCSVDVVEFDTAVAAGESEAQAGNRDGELRALQEAALLYQDDLLPGVYDDWLEQKREHYRQQAAKVFERLAGLLEERRDFAAGIRIAERLVAQDSLREAHHQLLIRLHAANGDRAGALRAYHQCMRVLRRELGVEPGAATRELFEHALKSDLAAAPVAELPCAGQDAHSHLIGRNREWRRLVEYWEVARAGGAHLAVIPGEPGIGKTRLADELYRWCRQHGAGVARARCYAAQGRLAYAPVAEWLRSEPLREARTHLPPSQVVELARVLPEILAENPGLQKPTPLTESWERRHFYDALNAAVAKARKPLLLAIDDLQWCDQDSFEWLHALFRTDLEGGVLVVATVRAEETDRNHPFTRLWSELRQSGQVAEIALAPLNAEQTAALGCQTAGRQLSEAEVAQLYRATQGNPLFVVESVRVGLGESSGGITAPPRVHAVIVARLAQLSPAAYDLAGLAGAIGRAFSFDLLAKATDWDEASVAQALEELWQRRIVEGKGGEYDFTHDRIREVAYAELSPVRRRFVHRRVARALEELHAGDLESVYSEMAAHCAAGDLAEEAIRYYREAASVAHQRYADGAAAAELRRAVELCRELPATAQRRMEELELLVALERTLLTTAGYADDEVGETSARAVALFRELGASAYGVTVLSGAWSFHEVRAEFEMARQLGEETLRLAAGDRQAVSRMSGEFVLGTVGFHTGRFEEAREHTERAVAEQAKCTPEELSQFAVPEIGIFCRAYLSHVLWHLGYTEQALATSEAAIAAAGEAHPFGAAIALSYAAMLHVFSGESREGLALAERASAVCRRYEFAYYLAMAEIAAGWLSVQDGDPDGGSARLRKGLDAFRATSARLRLPFYHALLAEAYMRAGRPGQALASVSSGLAFQSSNGELWAAPYLHTIQGDILLEDSNREQARSSYERALQAARQSGARVLALRSAVRIARMGGDGEPIRKTLRELCAALTEGFESPDVREARGVLDGNSGTVTAEHG
jgi:DNA-binding SARP family transcriptional activator/tetratricopeptide (TPR) repeat protein